jgi:hypothetical protein
VTRALLVAVLLILPAPASAQILDRALDLANGAALVAHAADYGSTVRCTTAGTCTEANPILRPFAGGDSPSQIKYFAIKWSAAFASYAVKTQTRRRYPTWTLVFAAAETATFFAIAHHNRQTHNRAKGQ